MADAHINKGIGIVWSISSGGYGTGTAILRPTEQDFSKTRQNMAHHDPLTAAVLGETFWGKESILRMSLYPSGDTNAQALNANKQVIEPSDELQVVDTDDPELAGYYTVLEVGKRRRIADKVYWDLSVRRHGNGNVGNTGVRISSTVQ
jgi:hypothetical protein